MAASQQCEEGFTVIPASRRPDGTWRKERKVKAGYVPPDEAPKYESKGKQWANSIPKLPPGMEEVSEGQDSKQKLTKNKKKNERRKQKKKENASTTDHISDPTRVSCVEDGVKNIEISGPEKVTSINEPSSTGSLVAGPTKDEQTKKIKLLKKKLRQIEDLENKLSGGEIKELTKEQKEKVAKKKQFSDELEDLELED